MTAPVDTPESVEALARSHERQGRAGRWFDDGEPPRAHFDAAAMLRRYAAALPVVEAARAFRDAETERDLLHKEEARPEAQLSAILRVSRARGALDAALANLPTEEAR